MTTRRLHDLPPEWAGPIFELLSATREATRPSEPPALVQAWVTATTAMHRPRTGYRAARRTAEAGTYAAHLLTAAAARHAAVDTRPWLQALAAVPATATNSWGTDRAEAAGTLRAALATLDDLDDAEALPAHLLARWLGHTGGPRLVCAGAELAAYVLADPGLDVADLRTAWLAAHHHTLTGSGQDRTDER